MEDFTPYPPPFRLDGRLVQPDLNRIDGPEGPVRIEPRIMQVLLVLARQPGKVIPREIILEQVWSDQIVGEENLTRAVSELRRIFGDDPRRARVIETIRNHGYRLIADVAPAEEAERRTPPPAQAPGSAAKRRPRSRRRLIPLLALVPLVVAIWIGRTSRDEGQGPLSFWSGPATPLTSFPGGERHPALSPDGRRVAFVRSGEDMPAGCVNALYIKQRGAEASLRLTGEPGWCAWPAWSPDGQMLAFVQGGSEGIALCTVAALGGAVRRLFRSGDLIEGVDWSRDGKWLVFSARDEASGSHKLMKLDRESLEAAVLPVSGQTAGEDLQPRVEPAGGDLAWIHRDPGGEFSLRKGLPDALDQFELAVGPGPLTGLAWLPDGRNLVFGAAAAPARLWVVPATGGDPRLLDTGPEYAVTPTVARRTGDLAFAQVRMNRDLVLIRVLSRDPWTLETGSLAPSTRGESSGDFSPDGRRIALVSERSGRPEVWLADVDGSNLVRLTDLPPAAVSRLRWSPAGDRIAFQVTAQGRDSVMTLAAVGGRPRPVPLSGARAALSGWTPDGGALIVAVLEEAGWRLRRIPVQGDGAGRAEGTLLTAVPATSGALESDDRGLFFTRPDQPGLWRVTLPDGEPELAIAELSLLDQGNWRLTGDHVAWVQRVGGRAYLVWRELATGDDSILADLPGLGPGGLSIAPGGSAFLYPRERVAAADIMFMTYSGQDSR